MIHRRPYRHGFHPGSVLRLALSDEPVDLIGLLRHVGDLLVVASDGDAADLPVDGLGQFVDIVDDAGELVGCGLVLDPRLQLLRHFVSAGEALL